MEIIFAKTRHTYDSYCDFWRLVDASGFRTCFVDEIVYSEPVVYITTPWNGETTEALTRPRFNNYEANKAKIVWWLLERDVCDGTRNITDEFGFVNQIWVGDRSTAKKDPRLTHVVLGGHPDIATAIKKDKEYDVTALAYLWGRRQDIANALVKQNVSVAPDAYGKHAQDDILPKSKLMLSMHQYDIAKIIAPLRFAVAASYGLPLLSETVTDSYPLIEGQHFVTADYVDLVNKAVKLLKDENALATLANNLKQLLTENFRFDKCVNTAVNNLINAG